MASVIVRCRDEEATLARTLSAVRAQTVDVELIVVDSGSADSSLSIAETYADKVIEIPPETFSYGRALNIGADAAVGRIHFALSAHCVPTYSTWVADSLRHYQDERVAATNQARHTPGGRRLVDTYLQTLEDARAHPTWGFSNHAASWRATVWSAEPFREDLVACEDKEWSWRVLAGGLLIAYDPRLEVPVTHRRRGGVRALARRAGREQAALVGLGALRRPTLGSLWRTWWHGPRATGEGGFALSRTNPLRIIELIAGYHGARGTDLLPEPTYVDTVA